MSWREVLKQNTRAGPTDATELFEDEKRRVWKCTWLMGAMQTSVFAAL